MASEPTPLAVGPSDNEAIESMSSFSSQSDAPAIISQDANQEQHQDGVHNNNSNDDEITQRLNQELALSVTHRQEVESRWRQILRKEKFQELHADISYLTEYHNQNIQRKKNVLESIRNEIDHLQELHHGAMVANLDRMEELVTVHDDQVILLEREFRTKVDSLQAKFRKDVMYIKTQYDSDMEVVRQCIASQQQKEHYQNEISRHEQQHELEEIKNRILEDINSLRFQLDSKVEDLEEQFEQAHSDFAQSTDFTKSAYYQLKLKDEQIRKEVEQKTRRADHLQSEIQRFQLIAKQEQAQNQERRLDLMQRKARAIQRFQTTKDQMLTFRKDQQQRLVELSRSANEKKELLRQQCALAKRVRKIAMACRKWETAREVFAFLLREPAHETIDLPTSTSTSNSLTDSEQSKKGKEKAPMRISWQEELKERASLIVKDQKTSATAALTNNPRRPLLWDTTHRFWDKYNMAQLDVLTLEKQVQSLKQKEKDLRKKLKLYHDGITVNDDVLNDRNPLLVINGKMNIIPGNNISVSMNDKGRKIMRRLTVVDANHVFATFKTSQCVRV